MAIPTLRAPGAVAAAQVAISPAAPAGHAAGDVDLLWVQSLGTDPEPTLSTANGFARLAGTAAAATRLTVFWRRWDGAAGVATVADTGDHQLGRMVSVVGALKTGNPYEVATAGTTAAGTACSIGPGTTTVNDQLCLFATSASLPDATGTASYSLWANSTVSDFVELLDNSTNQGGGGSMGVADGGLATAGATGTTTATGPNSAHAWILVTLQPLAPVTATGAAVLQPLTGSGTATFTAAAGTYTASAAAALPALGASGTATSTAPTQTGTGSATLGTVRAGGTATYTGPTRTGSGTAALPALTATGAVSGAAIPTGSGTANLGALSASGTGTLTAPQTAGPISTVAAGGWLPSTGATLWECVDEASRDDGDWMYVDNPGAGSTAELRLGPVADPNQDAGHVIEYAYERLPGPGSLTLQWALVEGATVRDSWEDAAIPTDWTGGTHTLSAEAAAAIGSYSDLRIRVTAVEA